MKKKIMLVTSILLLSPAVAFAAEVAAQNPKDAVLNAVFTVLGTALVGLLAWLGKVIGKFVNAKIEDINNDALQKIAYVAVRYAQDAIKKATGSEKYKLACEQVAKKLPGVSQSDIEVAVRAMYTNFEGEISKN